MAPEPLLLTVPEAATALQIGRDRTYHLVAEGRLAAVRLGRSIRIPRAALEEFIENELAQVGNGAA